MGKKKIKAPIPPMQNNVIDLRILTKNEAQDLLKVLEKDKAFCTAVDSKISNIREDIRDILKLGALKPGDKQQWLCARCRAKIWPVFHLTKRCTSCKFRVCKKCSTRQPNRTWICSLCIKQRLVRNITGDWYFHGRCLGLHGSDLIRASMRSSLIFKKKGQLFDPLMFIDNNQRLSYGSVQVEAFRDDHDDEGSLCCDDFYNTPRRDSKEKKGKRGSKDKGKRGSKDKGRRDSKDKGKRGSKDKGKRGSKDKGKRDSKDKGKRGSKDKGKRDSKDKGKRNSKDKGKGKRDSKDKGKGKDKERRGSKGSRTSSKSSKKSSSSKKSNSSSKKSKKDKDKGKGKKSTKNNNNIKWTGRSSDEKKKSNQNENKNKNENSPEQLDLKEGANSNANRKESHHLLRKDYKESNGGIDVSRKKSNKNNSRRAPKCQNKSSSKWWHLRRKHKHKLSDQNLVERTNQRVLKKNKHTGHEDTQCSVSHRKRVTSSGHKRKTKSKWLKLMRKFMFKRKCPDAKVNEVSGDTQTSPPKDKNHSSIPRRRRQSMGGTEKLVKLHRRFRWLRRAPKSAGDHDIKLSNKSNNETKQVHENLAFVSNTGRQSRHQRNPRSSSAYTNVLKPRERLTKHVRKPSGEMKMSPNGKSSHGNKEPPGNSDLREGGNSRHGKKNQHRSRYTRCPSHGVVEAVDTVDEVSLSLGDININFQPVVPKDKAKKKTKSAKSTHSLLELDKKRRSSSAILAAQKNKDSGGKMMRLVKSLEALAHEEPYTGSRERLRNMESLRSLTHVPSMENITTPTNLDDMGLAMPSPVFVVNKQSQTPKRRRGKISALICPFCKFTLEYGREF